MSDKKQESFLSESSGRSNSIAVRDGYDPMKDESSEGCCSLVMRYIFIFFSLIATIIPISWIYCIKIFDQYERAVIFRLGKLKNKQHFGPGILYLFPFIDTYRKVDMRIKSVPVAAQDVMTLDSVTIRVDAVIFFHVEDAVKAILTVQNFMTATTLLAATTLRCVVGESELDELLTKRDRINNKLKDVLVQATQEWGISIDAVEVSDIKLPVNMQRVMASQAEAERDRRAKIISAEGERQAAETLLNAAEMMSQNPATLQLRYLQTLTQIAVEHPTKVIFPLPMSLGSLSQLVGQGQEGSEKSR